MFTSAPMGMGKQTHTDDICTGMLILEKEMHSDSHQDPDTPGIRPQCGCIILQRGKEKGI